VPTQAWSQPLPSNDFAAVRGYKKACTGLEQMPCIAKATSEKKGITASSERKGITTLSGTVNMKSAE